MYKTVQCKFQNQLIPLNDELKLVNAHFEKFIALKKRELEDRRKHNSLAKFLSERVRVLRQDHLKFAVCVVVE